MAKITGTFGAGLFGQGPYGGYQPGQVGYQGDTPYLFSTPTVKEYYGGHGLFGRLAVEVGVTVIKKDGFYRQVLYPSQADIDGADAVYLGGHVYTIPAVVAADLYTHGYGDYLSTPVEWVDDSPDLSEKW